MNKEIKKKITIKWNISEVNKVGENHKVSGSNANRDKKN